MRKPLLSFLACFFVPSTLLAATAKPEIGRAAPPLHFTQLWQAPAGTKADWSKLRGKVVVLEFWATWCGPCVASVPHLNELAASVDPAKVQFISIDNKEDPKVVRNFLSKRKIAGWVGLDRTGATFRRYGVGPIPETVVVDTQGRIVAYTQPQDVTAEKLLALAAGKEAMFAPMVDISSAMETPATKNGAAPLFLLQLAKAPPGTLGGGVFAHDHLLLRSKPLGLLGFAYQVADDRLMVNTKLPDNLYILRGVFAGASDSVTRPMMQAAIAAGLNVRVLRKNVMKKVYVLQSTPQSHRLLVPSVPNAGGMQGYWNGKVHIVGGSMDALASALENAINQPVLNETGVKGNYDEELSIPQGDVAAAQTIVAKKLGLRLVEQKRSIPMIEIDAPPKTETTAAH